MSQTQPTDRLGVEGIRLLATLAMIYVSIGELTGQDAAEPALEFFETMHFELI